MFHKYFDSIASNLGRLKLALPHLPYRKLVIIFTVWASVVIGISYYATNELHVITDYESKAVINANRLPDIKAPDAIAGLPRWDSEWYLEIALHGYHPDSGSENTTTQQKAKVAFFPLYPALLRAVLSLHVNPVLAGVLINIALSFGALIFVYLLAIHFLHDEQAALRAGMLFLFFPSSFFLLGIYSEALFCFLSFGAFYFAIKRRWLAANVFLAFCTASRSPGAIVALAVFFEYLHSCNFNLRKLDRSIFSFLLAPLGFLIYAYYLKVNFGDPLLMMEAQKYWQQGFNPNIINTIWRQASGVVRNFITPGYNAYGTDWTREWTNMIVFASWLLGVLLTVFAFIKRLPVSMVLYMALSLIYFVSKGNFISVNRYTLTLFPMYIMMAWLISKREHIFSMTLAVSVSLMTFGLVEYSISYWTG